MFLMVFGVGQVNMSMGVLFNFWTDLGWWKFMAFDLLGARNGIIP